MSIGKIKIDDYMHVGIIVHNIEDALERMSEVFDIDEYRINDFPPADTPKDQVQLMYKGESTWFTARFCFIKMGDSELELIEPVEGNSVWKDYLEEHGEGVHHLKFEVGSLNEAMNYFDSIGIDCPQYGAAVGPNKGKTWAYFNTVEKLGYVVEVLNRQVGEIVQ